MRRKRKKHRFYPLHPNLSLCLLIVLVRCHGFGRFWETEAGMSAARDLEWVQQAYLKASNGEADDRFGNPVAISGDTVAIAAVTEASGSPNIVNGGAASSDNSLTGAGAVYVFARSGTSWVQQAYLKPANPDASDSFGASLAIDGDTIVVGAVSEDSSQNFVTNGSTIAGDNAATDSGAAYVFVRNGDTWSLEAYLKASNAEPADGFGASVAVSQNTIAVGAAYEDSAQNTIVNNGTISFDNGAADSGAVYIFQRTGSAWQQSAYIKASNADTGDRFGRAVALDADTLVVGADLEDSAQNTVLNTAAASTDNSSSNSGAAYVFQRSAGTWTQQAYLKASNSGPTDAFGQAVSISGDTIVVGAMSEDSDERSVQNGTFANTNNAMSDAGAAYIFTRSGGLWSQQACLKASNADVGDSFGFSVSISGDIVVVGARLEDSSQRTVSPGSLASSDNTLASSGAAYVFSRSGQFWAQRAYLKASNADSGDVFGVSVAVSNRTIIAGASLEAAAETQITNSWEASADNSAPNTGAAYIFSAR